MRMKVFISVFLLHLVFSFVVPTILMLGFFVESAKFYTKILAVLIFPVKALEMLGHPIDGWRVVLVILLTALFWAFTFSVAFGKIFNR